MTVLAWKPEYAVGIVDVDHEHRALIEWINILLEDLQRDRVQPSRIDPNRIEQLLGEIYARIAAHFALEEKIMRERRYDEYPEHKGDHERLLNSIRDMMDECLTSNDVAYAEHFDAQALASRLSEWFSGHFGTQDARFHRAWPTHE